MKNFEYYQEEIKNITKRGYGVAVVDNKPVACGDIQNCKNCQLANVDAKWRCHLNRMEWLYEEHVEQPKKPKLTKKERLFCELVETGHIARTKNGHLYFYESHITKPYKIDNPNTNIWRHDAQSYFLSDESSNLFNLTFDFIKWEDEEPWSVKDLLKLESEE